MGKRYKYIYIAVLLFLVCSCRLTHKLENTGYRPQVNQPGKVTTSATKDVAEKSVVSDAAGNTDEQVRTRDEKTGEDIVTVTLSEVTVVARTKTVPERFGMVNLDFIVTVPKTLIDKRWMITLTPTLEKSGEKIKLEDVVINEHYSCQKPIETIIYDENMELYQVGELMTIWELPQIHRDVRQYLE